jgi:hypothetical protein
MKQSNQTHFEQIENTMDTPDTAYEYIVFIVMMSWMAMCCCRACVKVADNYAKV